MSRLSRKLYSLIYFVDSTAVSLPLSIQRPIAVKLPAASKFALEKRSPTYQSLHLDDITVDGDTLSHRLTTRGTEKWRMRLAAFHSANPIHAEQIRKDYERKHDLDNSIDKSLQITAWKKLEDEKIANITPRKG